MRELSTDEIVQLLAIHALCRSGTKGDRAAARRERAVWLVAKRDQGVGLGSIAKLFGVSLGTVRRWCQVPDTAEPAPRPAGALEAVLRRRLPGTTEGPLGSHSTGERFQFARMSDLMQEIADDVVKVAAPIRPAAGERVSPSNISRRTTVLVIAGSDHHGNRLSTEIGRVRTLVEVAGRSWAERSGVSASEIGHHLRQHPATIVHLAFHAAPWAAEFENPNDSMTPVQLSFEELAEIMRPIAPPGLLILSGCFSTRLAQALKGWATSTVAWPGNTDDKEIRGYCHGLYCSLLRGECLQVAHQAGLANVSVVSDDRKPVQLGDPTWSLAHGASGGQ